jgi:DNA polymerase III, alpha subunit
MKQFVTCHSHPQSLDSASTPAAFAKREVELGGKALTATDHGTLAASWQIYQLAKKNGLIPIIGCLLPGQEIHTINGMKRVEEIEKGDLVLTHRGRYRRVTKTMSRQYDGEISRIFLARNGARGLPLTTKHPVLISNSKGETEWINPCDIEFGRNKVPPSSGNKWQKLSDGVSRVCSLCKERKKTEEFHKGKSKIDGKRGICSECCKRDFKSYVVIPKNGGEGSGTIIVEKYLPFPIFQRWKTGYCSYTKGGFYSWPKITPIIPLTKDFAYFLGLFFAEGTSQKNGASTLTFNTKEVSFVDFCVSFLRETFDIKVGTQERPEKGTKDLYFCNRPLALILRGMVGIGAHNKKVPREILECPNLEIRGAFLRGALDGDGKKGDKEGKGEGYIKLSSRNGIWGLKTLIADQGVYSEVHKVPSTKNGKKFVAWSVQFQGKAKFRRSLDFPEFIAVPIREVVAEKYSGPVYNFSVEEDESYVSDFVLHNCEAYFRDDNCSILQKLGIPKTLTVPRGNDKEIWLARHPNGTYVDYAKYFHLTLNFLDYEAYLCAVKLLSKADDTAEQYGSERKPIFTWNDIETLAAHNVMAGTSCLIGMVGRHLIREESSREIKIKAATQYFERLQSLFKERFYAELFPHVCNKNYSECVLVNVEGLKGKQTLKFYYGKKLKTNQNEKDGISAQELAAKYDSKKYQELIAVKNYWTWEEYPEKLKVLSVEKKEGFIQNECTVWAPNGDVQWGSNLFTLGMAKKHGLMIIPSDDSHFVTQEDKIVQDVRLAQSGNWRFSNSYHRKSSDEAYAYFKQFHNTTEKEFEGWVENSLNFAERFKGFEFKTEPSLPVKFYPKDTLKHAKELIQKYGRFVNKPEYVSRLKTELDILHRNGKIDLLPYFFLAEEQCRLHANQGLLTGPGRGSAAGLLFSYLLGITHIDPLQYGLSLERFITLDRINASKLPDIDLDFPDRKLLVGSEGEAIDVIEFEAEDGSRHTVPENMKLETNQGLFTVKEAMERNLDLRSWWLEKAIGENNG